MGWTTVREKGSKILVTSTTSLKMKCFQFGAGSTKYILRRNSDQQKGLCGRIYFSYFEFPGRSRAWSIPRSVHKARQLVGLTLVSSK